MKETQVVNAAKFNKNKRIIPTAYPINSEVMIKNINRRTELDPMFIGPFYVTNVTKGGLYVLRVSMGDFLGRDVPTSQICYLAGDNPALKQDSNGEEEFEVQAILNHKDDPEGVKGDYLYFVHWKDYDNPKEHSWIPPTLFDD
ncbi:hypothetical protein INT47_008665 [Mucor saturninus]|uniref:Chromo domain-containing protein n=1 Tax=Mucor saturninus TaxID=64648 RepID=A0A8H7VEI1_9FUNG|nr:hypothetical protein INT47_008665 [Mucor saturninus]